jgi:hypothetical protein
MLVGLSGNQYSLGPNDERDFPQDEALRLISAGYAVPVTTNTKIERAITAPSPERRAMSSIRGKRGKNVVSAD